MSVDPLIALRQEIENLLGLAENAGLDLTDLGLDLENLETGTELADAADQLTGFIEDTLGDQASYYSPEFQDLLEQSLIQFAVMGFQTIMSNMQQTMAEATKEVT